MPRIVGNSQGLSCFQTRRSRFCVRTSADRELSLTCTRYRPKGSHQARCHAGNAGCSGAEEGQSEIRANARPYQSACRSERGFEELEPVLSWRTLRAFSAPGNLQVRNAVPPCEGLILHIQPNGSQNPQCSRSFEPACCDDFKWRLHPKHPRLKQELSKRLTLFSRHGYHGISARETAGLADVSEATVSDTSNTKKKSSDQYFSQAFARLSRAWIYWTELRNAKHQR